MKKAVTVGLLLLALASPAAPAHDEPGGRVPKTGEGKRTDVPTRASRIGTMEPNNWAPTEDPGKCLGVALFRVAKLDGAKRDRATAEEILQGVLSDTPIFTNELKVGFTPHDLTDTPGMKLLIDSLAKKANARHLELAKDYAGKHTKSNQRNAYVDQRLDEQKLRKLLSQRGNKGAILFGQTALPDAKGTFPKTGHAFHVFESKGKLFVADPNFTVPVAAEFKNGVLTWNNPDLTAPNRTVSYEFLFPFAWEWKPPKNP